MTGAMGSHQSHRSLSTAIGIDPTAGIAAYYGEGW